MSSILDRIDDTLDDWHGSGDAMRWRPEPEKPTAEQVEQMTEVWRSAVVPAFRQLARNLAVAFEAMKPLMALLAEPGPSALDARYHQRQRNRRRRR